MQKPDTQREGIDEVLEADATQPRKIQCPSCGTLLTIPAGVTIRVAKCGQCKEKFWLPRPPTVSEDEVVNWLGREEEDEVEGGLHGEYPQPVAPEQAHQMRHQTLMAAAALDAEMRLVACDSSGALLEFPPHRLKDKVFRSAMPRACMQCGARSHLEAHVLIYAGMLIDSVSLEAEHAAGKLVLRSDEVKDLTPDEVLEKLPHVPNVPAPADLPMPYWLCDMCGTSKAVSGQIQINSKTGEGFCRLLIRNLRRAEEFLCGVGARGTHPHRELVQHAAQTAEKPWDSLSMAVQQRLEQWFKPASGELFLAYVADRNHSRTEDGMFGLVVSNRRIIHHMPLRHREGDVSQPLELVLSDGPMRGQLIVTLPAWKVAVKMDSDGIAKLRRALVQGKYQAAWR
jgi:hypothetical protein